MEAAKKTLYIGAHEDDVFISSAISISRRTETSYVLCVANGVSCNEYPANFFGIEFNSREDFVKRRLNEDMLAFDGLGLDVNENYFNFGVYNERTHDYINEIIKGINEIVEQKGIERIVTHSFPEAHPDHEVVCFCSHVVGHEKGLDVWEYPMYAFNNEGVRVDREFVDDISNEVYRLRFTTEENELRERLIKGYQSQAFIIDRFRSSHEKFRRMQRDFKEISGGQYFYSNKTGHPQPHEIRRAISTFLSNL